MEEAHHHHGHSHDHDHHEHHHPVVQDVAGNATATSSDGNMDVIWTKVAVMALISLTLVASLLPFWFKKFFVPANHRQSPTRALVTSVLLCFGAGVLLSTAMVHMLPEIRESFASLDTGVEPLAEIVMCCGFFLIYLVEELVFMCCVRDEISESREAIVQNGETDLPVAEAAANSSRSGYNVAASEEENHRQSRSGSLSARLHEAPTYGTTETRRMSHLHGIGAGGGVEGDSSTSTQLREFFTVLALSLHAVFEGLAVGLEDTTAGVWTLFAAIASHKFVISFCMGVELVSVGTPTAFFLAYTVCFALMHPIGIAIGLGVSQLSMNDAGYEGLNSTLQALAAGSILYVVAFEILQRERSKMIRPKIAQFIAVVVGFAALMTVTLLTPHEHDHGDEGHHEH